MWGHEKPGQPQLPAASIAIQFSRPTGRHWTGTQVVGLKTTGQWEAMEVAHGLSSPGELPQVGTLEYSYRVG